MCNGWKNRETWLVNLWFGDTFQMDLEDGIDISADYIRETVQNYVDDVLGVNRADFITDMLDMEAINYDELASHYETNDDAE